MIEEKDYHIKVDDHEGQCWHCGKVTPWVDLGFEVFLCLGPCSDAKWKEFEEARDVPQ